MYIYIYIYIYIFALQANSPVSLCNPQRPFPPSSSIHTLVASPMHLVVLEQVPALRVENLATFEVNVLF